jgi:hypothetical protein
MAAVKDDAVRILSLGRAGRVAQTLGADRVVVVIQRFKYNGDPLAVVVPQDDVRVTRDRRRRQVPVCRERRRADRRKAVRGA